MLSSKYMNTHQATSQLIIRRPCISDLEEADDFFERMIPLSYAENGIVGFDDDMEVEIGVKKSKLRADLASGGRDCHFLLAEMHGRIVGTIAYGPSNSLLNQTTQHSTTEIKEIGCLLILKEYQGRGIAMKLVRAILIAMQQAGHTRCCLDCGYANAQKMWLSKLGAPHYCMENYWQNGIDHYAWNFAIEDILERVSS